MHAGVVAVGLGLGLGLLLVRSRLSARMAALRASPIVSPGELLRLWEAVWSVARRQPEPALTQYAQAMARARAQLAGGASLNVLNASREELLGWASRLGL